MTQPTRAIALEWNSAMLIEVLVELAAQHGWQPLYCVSKNTEVLLAERFPKAIYHDTHDARYGRPAQGLTDLSPMPIDQAVARAISYYEVLALKQMDRMEIMGRFAQHDRFIHFHRLASYWTAVLDRLRPDVLIMPTAPHVCYDLVAYSLARLRGIKTVMFEHVTTEGMLIAIDDFENGLPPLMAAYDKIKSSADVPVLSDRLEAYWRKLQGSYEQAIPTATRNYLADAAARKRAEEEAGKCAGGSTHRAAAGKGGGLLGPLRAAAISARRKFRQAVTSRSLVAVEPPPPATDGHYKGQFYCEHETPVEVARAAALFRRSHVENLIRHYDAIAVTPDLSRPYVYVALHGQPERSTNPLGGTFDDQHVLIHLIASELPDGWVVYVKEHPSQFLPHFTTERGRWISFYEEAMTHPRVSFVGRNIPSFDMIDSARAVATITGTSSWEAIVRGVPTLLFGEAWFKGCEGAYSIASREECREALRRIVRGERPRPEAVRRFLKATDETAIVAYISSDEEALAGTPEKENIHLLANAIQHRYANAK